jgi:hypothetical protein
MITEAATFITFLGLVENWLRDRRNAQAKASEERTGAIEALLDAMKMTEEHLDRCRSGEVALRENRALTRLWQRAANRLKDVDPSLAQRCRFKGDYWTHPQEWTGQQIDAADIRIKRMSAEANRMLRGGGGV